MSLQMLAVVWRKSITVDEVVMIPAAYYHLAAGNCQLVHEHPPLSKILAGLPLLFVQPDETDPQKFGQAPDSPAGKWTYEERFWEENHALFESISFWARVPMIRSDGRDRASSSSPSRASCSARGRACSPSRSSRLSRRSTRTGASCRRTCRPRSATCSRLLRALQIPARAVSAERALLLGAAGGVACLTKFSMLMVAPAIGAVYLALCLARAA